MKAFKTIVCIILAACTFLLTGCNNWWDDAEKFRGACAKLGENPSIKITVENYTGTSYADLTLKTTEEEWLSGEDFYGIDSKGRRKLHCGDENWTGVLTSMTDSWKYSKTEVLSSFRWILDGVNGYLKTQSFFVRDGETIIMEARFNSRAWNVTKRTGAIYTFYMTDDWEIYKILYSDITFRGDRAVEEEIETIEQSIYYITQMERAMVDSVISMHYANAA